MNKRIFSKMKNALQIVTAAINRTPLSGIVQFGKNGCKTYSAKVNPMIAFVVGLQIESTVI